MDECSTVNDSNIKCFYCIYWSLRSCIEFSDPQGVIDERIGFFPASFAHQVRAGDRVFRCNRTFIGCKEQGQITLKEGQVSDSLLVLLS